MPAKTASTPRRLSGGKAKTASKRKPKGTLVAQTNVKADYSANMYFVVQGSLVARDRKTKRRTVVAKDCCTMEAGRLYFTMKGDSGNIDVRSSKMARKPKKKVCA